MTYQFWVKGVSKGKVKASSEKEARKIIRDAGYKGALKVRGISQYASPEFGGKSINPRQPDRRVRKALKKYVGKQLGLPTQYTPAKVRVDSKGEIDIKFSRPPKGATRNPKRFSVQARGNIGQHSIHYSSRSQAGEKAKALRRSGEKGVKVSKASNVYPNKGGWFVSWKA